MIAFINNGDVTILPTPKLDSLEEFFWTDRFKTLRYDGDVDLSKIRRMTDARVNVIDWNNTEKLVYIRDIRDNNEIVLEVVR